MPETRRSLDIIGYDKKPIKNALKSAGKTDKIAIIFPGVGYTCRMPVLYYASAVLLKKGYDVLWVEYDYKKEKFDSSTAQEKTRWLDFDAEASYKTATAEGKYKHIMLVGKSLGTFALVYLNDSIKIIEKSIWLTPLLGKSGVVDIEMYEKVKGACRGGLFIIGTADPHYDKARIRNLESIGAKFVSIEGADHSLEIESEPFQSLKVLGLVAKEVDKFA